VVIYPSDLNLMLFSYEIYTTRSDEIISYEI
jgi:hypothetical protein